MAWLESPGLSFAVLLTMIAWAKEMLLPQRPQIGVSVYICSFMGQVQGYQCSDFPKMLSSA